MRIGLASDSHGNLDALGVALDLFVRAEVDRVFFLGGRVADVDQVLARRRAGHEAGRPPAPVPETDLEFLAAVEGALRRQARAAEHPLAAKIVRVPSRACPEHGRGLDPKVIELVEGKVCSLVHDKGDLDRDDITNAQLIFHGNSARAAVVQIGPRCFVTPGHLRAPAPEGRPATFALVEVGAADVRLTVFSDEGAEIGEQRGVLGAGSKLSVR